MNAEIITIGNEILIGQITDTNTTFIAEQLTLNGIQVSNTQTVPDARRSIINAINLAISRAGLVIITGGLGPTNDDITKKTLCEFFETELIINEEVLADVKNLILRRSKTINESNRKQAEVPKSAVVLRNTVGTAPGLWLEKNHVIVVALPGVPFEMKYLMLNEVLPRIKKNFNLPFIVHKTINTYGMPESSLSEKLADWEKNLNEKMELAYLPSPKGIKLRLTYVGKQKNILENAVNEQVEKLKLIIPELIFGYGETSLENAVAELLISQGKTVATAESCTGGYIAHLLTSISGSSAFFKGSVVAYANSVKEDVLHVSKENITNYGAVSEAVVKEMALQAKKMMNTDFAIATSGIAGPDGGTADKPVGTVWIAVATDNEVIARLHNFFVLREINIMHAASSALNMLRIKLLENKQ